MAASGSRRAHRRRTEDGRRQVRQEGAARSVRGQGQPVTARVTGARSRAVVVCTIVFAIGVSALSTIPAAASEHDGLPRPAGPHLRVPAWKLENALACPSDLSGPVV